MKANNKIILGIGMGYIAVSSFVMLDIVTLLDKTYFLLGVSALLFALSEFFSNGGVVVWMKFKGSIFFLFSHISYFHANKLKAKILKDSKKKYNYLIYAYWIPKCIANFLARSLRRTFSSPIPKHTPLSSLSSILASTMLVGSFADKVQ